MRHPQMGTLGHITSELSQQHAGIKMTHVPYRGTAPLTTDLLGGQVHVGTDFMPTYVPLVNDGRLRALAVTSSERAPELPNVMTVREAGFPASRRPPGTRSLRRPARPTISCGRSIAATNDYLKSQKGKAQLIQFSMLAAGGTPDDLKAYVASELKKWGRSSRPQTSRCRALSAPLVPRKRGPRVANSGACCSGFPLARE